ncbi:MAG: hypothetical protein R3F59_37290 [Myxococcota bacterium]
MLARWLLASSLCACVGDIAGDTGTPLETDADTDTDTDADADTDTDADADTDTTSLACAAAATEADCLAAGCGPVYGCAVNETGGDWCVDFGDCSYAGCLPEQTCTDYPVTARPEGGDCEWFGSSCVPEGWTLCDLGYLVDC